MPIDEIHQLAEVYLIHEYENVKIQGALAHQDNIKEFMQCAMGGPLTLHSISLLNKFNDEAISVEWDDLLLGYIFPESYPLISHYLNDRVKFSGEDFQTRCNKNSRKEIITIKAYFSCNINSIGNVLDGFMNIDINEPRENFRPNSIPSGSGTESFPPPLPF